MTLSTVDAISNRTDTEGPHELVHETFHAPSLQNVVSRFIPVDIYSVLISHVVPLAVAMLAAFPFH